MDKSDNSIFSLLKRGILNKKLSKEILKEGSYPFLENSIRNYEEKLNDLRIEIKDLKRKLQEISQKK